MYYSLYFLKMKPRKCLQYFIAIFNVNLCLLTTISAQNSKHATTEKNVLVPKCAGFFETGRSNQDHSTNSSITQTAYNSERQPITLELVKGSKKGLKCDIAKTEEMSISWKHENQTAISKRRKFYSVSDGSTARHTHSYFTETGHFYDKQTGNYYDPEGDYCVQSISDDRINLRICDANSDCSNSSTPNTYCLPKCCALDETLLFWKRQCVRLPETHGKTPWKPTLYEGPKNPHKLDQSNPNIIYHMAQLNCHPLKYNVAADFYSLLSDAFVQTRMPDRKPKAKDDVKLILPTNGKNGKIQVMSLYYSSRKWKEEKFNFCVDGFHVKSKNALDYSGQPDNFVVFYCPNTEEHVAGKLDTNSKARAWTYALVSLFVLVFLLATLLVYLALWDKHNLNGLTILGFTGSTFGSFLFLTVAHFISLSPNGKTSGSFCYVIGVLAHYFYLATYMWLSVINFDHWITFKSFRVVCRNAKEWRKFKAYLAVGFAFPAALVIAFVVVDQVYRDPLTEVPVPDYAMGTCFVSPDFRGEYVYTPAAIVLAINFVLIGMTMWIFIRARRLSSTTLKSGAACNVKSYDEKLFGKLFLVMGGTTTVDFITWYYNNKGYKPWYIVFLEVIKYLSPVALFILFCLNDKIQGQLQEKFPAFMGKLDRVLRWFTKEEDTEPLSKTSKISNRISSNTTDMPLEEVA